MSGSVLRWTKQKLSLTPQIFQSKLGWLRKERERERKQVIKVIDESIKSYDKCCKTTTRTSPVIQWLRIHLPMQGT